MCLDQANAPWLGARELSFVGGHFLFFSFLLFPEVVPLSVSFSFVSTNYSDDDNTSKQQTNQRS
jgi:hypothetical protein